MIKEGPPTDCLFFSEYMRRLRRERQEEYTEDS